MCSFIPLEINSVFVTKISSPTTSILSPNSAVNFLNPSQSSSAKGSSQRTIGYFFSHSPARLIKSSLFISPIPDHFKLYLSFLLTLKEVAALSIAIAISSPGLYPAFSIASIIISIASSLLFKLGANPPSSPTLVAKPLFFNIFFNV